MENKALTTLADLADRLRLPMRWLKDEAIAGRIPCLKVGRRLLFQDAAVESALAERAAVERVGGTTEVANAR